MSLVLLENGRCPAVYWSGVDVVFDSWLLLFCIRQLPSSDALIALSKSPSTANVSSSVRSTRADDDDDNDDLAGGCAFDTMRFVVANDLS